VLAVILTSKGGVSCEAKNISFWHSPQDDKQKGRIYMIVKKKITGVVIGKFYPLHKGHNYLIETALSQVDELTVIVGHRKPHYKNGQLISGYQRASWIKQIHPTVHKIYIVDDKYDIDDPKIWAENAIRLIGHKPDLVFTSENYGEPFAKTMGSKHILVDKARLKVPISGTKVRTNPLKNLEFLHPIVRAYFVKRVAIVGAESSGKTTLAKDLAKHFKTNWVPEYGRMYSEGKLFNNYGTWDSAEFVHIAQKQNEMEDKLAETAEKVLICDTNAFATSIWHERYMKFFSESVQNLAKKRKYDLVIVTDASIRFEQDGTRDGEHIRNWMQQRFLDELEKSHVPYIFLSGSREKRLKEATNQINIALDKPFFS
jgi:HTH-type transcriptional regulator, transcriptional repressor of NAD biosynthesis genes